jgi:LDH2 family malate/lactate/ureidoglycolate dehydrogenase
VLSGGVMLNNVGGIRVKSIPMGASHMFLAIDVARFLPTEQFTERMQWLRETITHAQPAHGFDEVLIAGDPEWRMEAARLRDGIPVSRGIWDQLTQLAQTLNVSVP